MNWNNAFYLVIPVFLIRYLYVHWKSREKLAALDFFPPAKGMEKAGKATYLVVNTFLLFYPLFLKLEGGPVTFSSGFVMYCSGILLYFRSINDFVSGNGLISDGTYRHSRNPQSVSFILIYTGIALVTRSLIYFILTLILLWAFNQLAKSEERYCMERYGQSYADYLRYTRRFL